MPLDIVSYMSMCTEETTQELLNAVISSMQLQGQEKSIWLSALSIDQTLLDYDVKYLNRQALKHFSHNDILEAQKQDKVIRRVLHYFKINRPPARQEGAKEAPARKQLPHEWQKLSVDMDGILRRKNGPTVSSFCPKGTII